MLNFFKTCFLTTAFLGLQACDQISFPDLAKATTELITAGDPNENPKKVRQVSGLEVLIEGSGAKVDVDAGFLKALEQALDQDPVVLAAQSEVAASRASLLSTETGRNLQINASVLGGVEDITDETVGVAAILTATRILYDGGMLRAKIDSDAFMLKSVEQQYLSVRSQRALKLAYAWIELEHYRELKSLIVSRLEVLDPLFVQLDSVATAGVGDVSQVASAQRVVSSIRLAETDVEKKLQQAEIVFINGFGRLPVKAKYDASWVSKKVPTTEIDKLVANTSELLSVYWGYRAAEAAVVAVEAKNKFNLGFKAQLQRPFGGSGAGADESIGLVLSKDIYQGEQLKSQIKYAEDNANVMAARVRAAYREGDFLLASAQAMIKSMDESITLARINAKSSREEIDYLRKQLIIGGSTLQSVLSAEAQQYDAESMEINFIAERLKAEAAIVAASGQF